jgi:catechol 2,3-dioxygenase-like lactoylglutathione lyase family enzyme
MRIRRLCWVGVPAREYDAMLRFLRDVLGLRTVFERESTAELELENGDRIQVFGPEHPYFERFEGPVPLLEVDDVHAARAELVEARCEVGPIEADDEWEWIDFRAPDGKLYELASRRA